MDDEPVLIGDNNGQKQTSSDSANTAPETDPVADVAIEFMDAIESLRSSIGQLMLGLQASERNASRKMNNYAEKYGDPVEDSHESTRRVFRFKPPYDAKAGRLQRRIRRAETAVYLLPRVYLLALVSRFDAFLGQLLRALYRLQPRLLSGIEYTVTFESLTEAGSIDAITDEILDKQIESLLRKSRAEQFAWLEGRFKVELTKGLDSWPTLIESTERRNLYAHSDGRVSDQYLRVCSKHGAALDDGIAKGSYLDVTPEYFNASWQCHLEVGMKLSQVLWRKVCPGQLAAADGNLTEVAVELITDDHLDVAKKILDFAVSPAVKHASEEFRLMHVINRAQAYKWSGDDQKCDEIVGSEDWSATDFKFRLATAVLQDDFGAAGQWMERIGPKGSVRDTDYQEWPIFRKFRTSTQFLETYEKVFGKPCVHIEKPLAAYEEEQRREDFEHLKQLIEKELGDDASEDTHSVAD